MLRCPECSEVCTSDGGLKLHMRRKHLFDLLIRLHPLLGWEDIAVMAALTADERRAFRAHFFSAQRNT